MIHLLQDSPRALRRWLKVVAAVLMLSMGAQAFAATLDQAKAQGWIGEKPDGYLGLVRGDAPQDVQALVADVNGKRRANYQRIASRQGVPPSEVEKVGGQTAIEKTAPGHYVMDGSGRWRQK